MRAMYERPMAFSIGLAVCCVAAGPVLGGDTIYVDGDATTCPGSGTEASPYCKIQTGINNSIDGDEVLVHPGT